MELAPAFRMPAEEVAKASQGHDPLPFLISELKNLHCKGKYTNSAFPKKYFFGTKKAAR